MKIAHGLLTVVLGSNLAGVALPTIALAEDPKEVPQEIRAFHLANATNQNDFNDVQTALRNMLTKPRIYGLPLQDVITVRGTPEDLQLAEKLLADLDHPRKIYRLTYTITDSELGKTVGTQHIAVVLAAGAKTDLKQGSKVPVVTGSYDTSNAPASSNTQVQYLDVGLQIKATITGDLDGIKLESQITESSVAESTSDYTRHDPVIRQTVLEGSSDLKLGKPLILGSIDVTGSTRHQDVEVVAELVK